MTPAHEARRPAVDLLRIVAAFGIVWAHMGAPGMVEGYVALAAFLILTAFLSFRSLDRRGERMFWLGRLVRIALPWAVWSGLFLALGIARAGGAWVPDWPEDPFAWLIGPSLHLWFLPFVLVASPLIVAARRLVTTAARVWWAAALLAPAALLVLWLHDNAALPAPFAQWAFATGPTLYGLIAAAAHRQGARGAPAAFAATVYGGGAIGWGSLPAPFMIAAVILFEAAWRLPMPGSRWTGLGTLAFGVYLTHPVFMLVWHRVAGGMPLALGAVAVFTAALAATWTIHRLPGGRWVA